MSDKKKPTYAQMEGFIKTQLFEMKIEVEELKQLRAEVKSCKDTMSALATALCKKELITKEEIHDAIRELYAYRLEKSFDKDS